MAYDTLGARTVTAAPDTTGFNPGRWTASFTAAKLGVSVPVYEIYKIVVKTTAGGGAVALVIGNQTFSLGPVGKGAEWDPVQPAIVRPGQEVFLMFSQATSVTPAPTVTIWLRYDPGLERR